MTVPKEFANEPMSIFVQLSQASYAGSIEKCFQDVDHSLKQKHQFTALAREEVDCYPIYLCSYKDTAGKIHHAVTCKGIYGEEGQYLASRNLWQALDAFVTHFSPESSIFTKKVHKVLENWQQGYKIEIDTLVGHSAGNRIVKIGRKYLAEKKPSVLAIAFNPQRPGPEVLNLTTTYDPVAHTIWDQILGPQTNNVCTGGHSLSYFNACEEMKLGGILSKMSDEEFKKISGQSCTDLQKALANEPIPSEQTLNKIESLTTQLSEIQETEKERQQVLKNLSLGFKLGAAAAEGFEIWVRENTIQMVTTSTTKMEKENLEHLEKLSKEKQALQTTMRNYQLYSAHLQTAQFASKQLDSNHDQLKKQLQNLKQNVSEWKEIQQNIQQNKDETVKQREKLLQEKIAEEKNLLAKILKGVSTTCDLASLAIEPFCAPAGAGVKFFSKGINATSTLLQSKTISQETKRQEEANRLQNKISDLSMQEEFASNRSAFQEQRYLETLDHFAYNKDLEPKLFRKLLIEKNTHWEQKLSEHENRKKTFLEQLYLNTYKTFDFPPHIQSSKETDTTRKREYFFREGYKQTLEGKAWDEDHKALAGMIQENKKVLAKENQTADIRDRSYEVFQYWGNFWSPSDKTTRDFSEALDECVHNYFRATQEERESILNTLGAFEQVFCVLGCSHLQKGALAGQLSYKLSDLGRYGYTTWFPNIQKALTGPGSFVQNLGGVPKLLSGYLEPLIQFAIFGIQLIQLAKGEEPHETKAEIRTRQLQYLSEQMNHLQETLEKVAQSLTQQNQSIQKNLKQTHLTIENVKEEICKELEKATNIIEKKLDRQEYDRITSDREKTFFAFKDSFQKKLSKKPSLEMLGNLLLTQLETCERKIESGPCLPDTPGQLKVPEYLPLIYQNPSHHTATLLSLIEGKNLPLPNLNQYLQLVSNYLQAVECLGEKKELADIGEKLILHGQRFKQFIESYGKVCVQASSSQKKLLSLFSTEINTSLKTEESTRIAKVQEIASELEKDTLKKLVGEARYGLITTFGTQPIPHLQIPLNDEIAKRGVANYPKYREGVKGGAKIGGGMGLGFASVFPILTIPISGPLVALALFAIGGTVIGGGGAAIGASGGAISSSIIDIENNIKSIHDFVSKKIRERDFPKNGEVNLSTYTINIRTTGRLHELFIDQISYAIGPHCPLRAVYKSSLSGKKFDVLHIKYGRDIPNDLLCYKTQQQITIPSSFSLSEVEKNKLSNLKIQSGNEKLIQNYLTIAKTQQPTETFTQSFMDKSQWVPSTDPKLIPLAFPKMLMDLFEREKRKLAIHGIELTPAYSFMKENEEYVLSLEFFADNEKYSSLRLATFDKHTLLSFGAPIITENGLKHEEPNWSEFLITAMYTSLQKDLGLPGKDTVALRNQTLIAPVDLPFAGVYDLLAKEISTGSGRMIAFDSKTYQGDNEVFGGKLALEKEKSTWKEKQSYEKPYQEYLKQYHTLKAMLSLQIDIAPEELDPLLFQIGLLLETNGNIEDLYEQIIHSPKIEKLLDLPVEENLRKIPMNSPLSKRYSALIGALEKLKQL